jgi:type I restriction enzyme, S subunit
LSNTYLKHVDEKTTGTTRSRISRKNLGLIHIPIPPLPEQKRIVAKLEQAFTDIDQAKANVERNLQNAKDLFQSKLNDIFSQNGDGWVEKKLGEVSEIIYGYTAKANHESGTARYLRITDIQDKKVNWETVPFCDLDEPEFLRYSLIAGDIVFARTGATTGKSYLISNPPKAVFASYLIRVQINSKELNSAFLYLFFQSGYYWDLINKGITGSAQGGFNASKLKELTVSYPESVKIQARYVEEMGALVTQIQALQAGYQQEQKALQELKKSILQKAFNGEL